MGAERHKDAEKAKKENQDENQRQQAELKITGWNRVELKESCKCNRNIWILIGKNKDQN